MCPLVFGAEYGLSGRKLIASAVVGVEALSRLGYYKALPRKSRFHTWGYWAVGGAIACAAALGANEPDYEYWQLASMSAGLLAFAKSDGGGMIKRLHLGRSQKQLGQPHSL